MSKELLQNKKSIMYKIISLGYSVYIDEWDDFVITVLLCQDCNHFWNKSRTECMYCGTENYHVFKCTKCNTMYSITNATQKCSKSNCNGILVKKCINPNCISNTNSRFTSFLDNYGGVFNIGKSASTLNEMHCKNCGSFTSTFKSVKAKLVENFDNSTTLKEDNVLYIKKNGKDNISASYNGSLYSNLSIENVLIKVFNIGSNKLMEA